MKVITQLGLLDINPEDVVSIRPAPVLPENMDYCDLTYCVEFDDRFYSMGNHVVCISEEDAEKLSELSGVEISGRKEKRIPGPENNPRAPCSRSNNIFVPYKALLALSEWENHFDSKIAWGKKKNGAKSEPENTPDPAPSSFSSDDPTLYEENHQPISLIEQAFRAQNNCTVCGKLVYDESRLCSGCIEPWI